MLWQYYSYSYAFIVIYDYMLNLGRYLTLSSCQKFDNQSLALNLEKILAVCLFCLGLQDSSIQRHLET